MLIPAGAPDAGPQQGAYDELRNFLRPRPRYRQSVSAEHHQLHVLCAAMTPISIPAAT